MNYREIVSVTGAGGLYQLVGSKGDGALLRQLGEQAVKFMPARKHSITQLETIEVYTTGDNVPLHEVFRHMQQSNENRPAAKAGNADIKAYFKTVYPELDEDRVYISDMKKMLKWYDILEQNDMLTFPEPEGETNEEEAAPNVDVVEEAMIAEENKPDETDLSALAGEPEKPAKKATKKTASKKAAESNGDAGEAETPKKKAAPKKKKEEE